jgi:hypothetical protein
MENQPQALQMQNITFYCHKSKFHKIWYSLSQTVNPVTGILGSTNMLLEASF